jgi:hypothetical protein
VFDFLNNVFRYNTAKKDGGAIKWPDKQPLNIHTCGFKDNKATYGNDVASFAIKMDNSTKSKNRRFLADGYLNISNIASG